MNGKVYCNGTRIKCLQQMVLTVGMVGAEVEFDFSEEWDGLGKLAVFRSDGSRDVIVDENGMATVPHEILTTPGMDVEVGVYAVREDGTTWPAPTPFCKLTRTGIEEGTDPSGDESYPPTPDVGEQAVAAASKALEAASAAQEVAAEIQRRADAGEFDGKDGGYYTPAVTQPDDTTMRVNFTPSKAGMASVSAVDVTLPSGGSGGITEETDPTVPAWAKADTKPTYTAAEVGALPADTKIPTVPTTLPNPNKLTFSGAVEAEYDGSSAVEVVIPAGGGGMSVTAADLLVTILRNAEYSADQSDNITALATALNATPEPDAPDVPDEPVVVRYAITNNLTECVNSNAATSLTEGASYTATLTASDGFVLDAVTVTMGGADVTASVYADGVITIPAVTGDVVITAVAVEESTDENNGWVSGQAYELNKVDCLALDTTTGETVEAETGKMVTDFLPCLGVSAFVIDAYDGASVFSAAFYDENKTFIVGNSGFNLFRRLTANEGVCYAPRYDNVGYVRFTQRSDFKCINAVTPIKFQTFTATTSWVEGQVYELDTVPGKVDVNTGVITKNEADTWDVTDYLPIYGAAKVTFLDESRKSVVWYDGDKNIISGQTINNTVEFVPPEGAVYMVAAGVDMRINLLWVNG